MSYHRKPKTAQEARAAFASPVAVRGKRTPRALPTSYSDIDVAARRDRSWKRYRAAQWRAAMA